MALSPRSSKGAGGFRVREGWMGLQQEIWDIRRRPWDLMKSSSDYNGVKKGISKQCWSGSIKNGDIQGI